jgi:hypothetical protein
MSKLLALILSALGLAACGGGGGPISEAQAQTVAPIEVANLHCIIRPNDAGQWFVQNDVDHSPSGCSLQIEQGPDYLRVFFLRTFTHAGTVQITSDDDFNVKIQGFANLGLNSTMIRVYANGQMINPADVYNHISKGGGNFWINVTMMNKLASLSFRAAPRWTNPAELAMGCTGETLNPPNQRGTGAHRPALHAGRS